MKKCFLQSPHMDKNYSLHIFHSMKYDYPLVDAANEISRKYIFFQGRSDNWLMIEFWTDDQDFILDFCEKFAMKFEADLEIVSDFTLEQIKQQRDMWR